MANVVVFENDVPKYELAGDEIIFPLTFEQEGTEVAAYFTMDAQYGAHEVKSFLDDLISKTKASDFGNEKEFESGDESGLRAFVTKHFKGILGIDDEATTEDMLAWLNVNQHIKTRIFGEGYDNLVQDAEEVITKLRIGLGSGEGTVKAKRAVYVPEIGVVILHLKYNHRRVTEEDRLKHKRAQRMVQKGPRQILRVNWDVMEQIADSLMTSVNFLIDGKPCTEANKPQWIGKVPFTDKIHFVNRLMSRVAVKNG